MGKVSMKSLQELDSFSDVDPLHFHEEMDGHANMELYLPLLADVQAQLEAWVGPVLCTVTQAGFCVVFNVHEVRGLQVFDPEWRRSSLRPRILGVSKLDAVFTPRARLDKFQQLSQYIVINKFRLRKTISLQ